jgi:hypothetical protein
MLRRIVVLLVGVGLLIAGRAAAQEQLVLSFETAKTDLQTGQVYNINIRVDGASQLWVVSLEIGYNPQQLYVMGTKSGAPVQLSGLFAGDALVVRNQVSGERLLFAASRIPPGQPIDGGGVIGAFRVYPLMPGKTTLTFSRAELVKLLPKGDGTYDQQTVSSFTPVLLELNVTGDPVQPPSEATATPLPTETFTPAPTVLVQGATEQPTLVNVTAAPGTTPLATLPVPTEEGSSGSNLLPIALAIMVVGALGVAVVAFLWWRSRRR